jgi:hypothetical protein
MILSKKITEEDQPMQRPGKRKRISEGDRVSKEQLKILSIVGFGGLGKTTLAREVYDALPTKFDYKAFVSVSRNPDMKKVLSNLLFKLDNRRHPSLNAENMDVEQLIILVQKLLSKKRYASPTQRTMSFILLQMPSTQVAHTPPVHNTLRLLVFPSGTSKQHPWRKS